MRIEFTVTGLKPRRRKRPESAPNPSPVPPVVQTIVLAYQIEEAVREGRARDYADVARQVGMTRARVSQIVALLRLSPLTIEALLLNKAWLHSDLTERQLRNVIAATGSASQVERIKRLIPGSGSR